ncbi:MAG: transcriptional regulator [Clostridium sp.]|nr:transcriptional regulator [Clostridium sp.]
MPKSEQQKAKILYLLKLLKERSDETHPVTTQEIITYLAEQDICVERKTIYADIEVLRDFGYDIILNRAKKGGGYYLAEREFELPELKLLVDLVQSSKFITLKKSREFIKKLEGFASVYEARQLQRQVFVANRVKTENESIYYLVDDIYRAIDCGRMIAFQYMEMTPDKKERLRRGGKTYEVSPWALTWNDDCYYLIAYDDEADKIKHYRVDRMHRIRLLDDERKGQEAYRAFDPAAYCKKTFRMFAGTEEFVTLCFDEAYSGVVFDRFGKDVMLRRQPDGHFTISVPIMVSNQFFGWLAGLGTGVRVEAPAHVAEEYRAFLGRILTQYET